jgi:hypothetical protein
VLALSTLTGYSAAYGMARRKHVWTQLPPQTKNALNLTMGAVVGQVCFCVLLFLKLYGTYLLFVRLLLASLPFCIVYLFLSQLLIKVVQ